MTRHKERPEHEAPQSSHPPQSAYGQKNPPSPSVPLLSRSTLRIATAVPTGFQKPYKSTRKCTFRFPPVGASVVGSPLLPRLPGPSQAQLPAGPKHPAHSLPTPCFPSPPSSSSDRGGPEPSRTPWGLFALGSQHPARRAVPPRGLCSRLVSPAGASRAPAGDA